MAKKNQPGWQKEPLIGEDGETLDQELVGKIIDFLRDGGLAAFYQAGPEAYLPFVQQGLLILAGKTLQLAEKPPEINLNRLCRIAQAAEKNMRRETGSAEVLQEALAPLREQLQGVLRGRNEAKRESTKEARHLMEHVLLGLDTHLFRRAIIAGVIDDHGVVRFPRLAYRVGKTYVDSAYYVGGDNLSKGDVVLLECNGIPRNLSNLSCNVLHSVTDGMLSHLPMEYQAETLFNNLREARTGCLDEGGFGFQTLDFGENRGNVY